MKFGPGTGLALGLALACTPAAPDLEPRLPTAPEQLGFGPQATPPVSDWVANHDASLRLRGLAPLRSEPSVRARELRIWVRVFATDLLLRITDTSRQVDGELIYFTIGSDWIEDAAREGTCVMPRPPLSEPARERSCASPRAIDFAVLLERLEAHQIWTLPFHTPPAPGRTHATWILVEAREGHRYRAWASHPHANFDEAEDVAAILDLVVSEWKADGSLGM